MNIAPWQPAVDAQLNALASIELMLRTSNDAYLRRQWATDRGIVSQAQPYCWGEEPTAACLASMASVPLDSAFSMWNISMHASCWWFFAKPLPYQTVDDPSLHVRALSFGWIGELPTRHFAGRQPGALVEMDTQMLRREMVRPLLCISAYIDHPVVGVSPTQLFYWKDGETVAEMLTRVRAEHRHLYGPGGTKHEVPQIGEDKFMEAAEVIARFVLAGMTWLRQRVVVEQDERIERHARKRYVKATGRRDEPIVKVISLRRAERKVDEGDAHGEGRKLSVRFMVGLETGGFFRNQACGPKMGDRRLTWILPFQKGPADAPLKLPTRRVFVVSR